VVSTGLIRLALKRIAETLCGASPGNICVLVPSATAPRVYVASVPVGYRPVLYRYLAEQIGLSIPHGNDPLVLTAVEATVAIELAEQMRRSAKAEAALPDSPGVFQ